MNLEKLEWDSYPLGILGVSKDQFPPVADSMQNMGHLPAYTAELLGLPNDVDLVMGVYDGGSVGIGLGCMSEGAGIINLGTTAMLRVASNKPMVDANPLMRLQTCYLADRRWFPGGGINNAGIVLKWLRDSILGLSYDELINEAMSVDNSAGLFCLPFLSGERNPQIGNLASGIFFGLRAYHNRGHMVRAALEGVVYMMRLISESLEENDVGLDYVKAGGGGSRSVLWMQTIASVLQKPIVTSSVTEPALLGSAIIGFTSLSRYSSIDEATSVMTRTDVEYKPVLSDVNHYNDGYDFYKYLVSHVGDMYAEYAKRGL
jgi:gluconokinase